MSMLLELSMSPFDKGESLSKYVSQSLDIIDKSGLNYRLNPMGTVIEGQWDEVFAVVKQCFNKMEEKSNRISIQIKIDYRKDSNSRLSSKITSLEKQLNKKLKV